jgi:hypothetical protein
VSGSVVRLVASLGSAEYALLPPSGWALCGGFALWVVVFVTLPRPARTYIVAHEVTHALWAWAMGAKVHDIRINKQSGSVTLSKSNFLIALAPYFFPLYTILLILTYYALSLFYAVERYHLAWLTLVGFTWAFHVTFTITTLLQKQSDIREHGYVFSYAVIFLLNVAGIGLWVVIVSTATLEEFARYVRTDLAATTKTIMTGFHIIWEWATQYFVG